jgi:hypothetical protein
LEPNEEPFIFHMDSCHYGKLPCNSDNTVYYFLLIKLWVLYSKEFTNAKITFRQICDAIFFDPKKHQIAIDVCTPQQTNQYDCALFMLKYIEAVLQSSDLTKSSIATCFTEYHITDKEIKKFRTSIYRSLVEARKSTVAPKN